VDRYLKIADNNDLKITAAAVNHIHADYASGVSELMEHHVVTSYPSAEGGSDCQFEWVKEASKARFLRDGDVFKVGSDKKKKHQSKLRLNDNAKER